MDISTATKLDLLIADAQGTVKYTVLPTVKPKKSDLIMSSTKGVRTNTNRRGQSYNGHATHALSSTVSGNHSAYFKTSG